MAKSKLTILAIGSHPDDIEFGCGGTLRNYTAQGHCTHMLILTHGESGGNAITREKEQIKSAKILGIKEIFWTNFTDTKLPFYENVIVEIECIVQKLKPSFVFVHSGNDTHQDHRHVSSSAVVATRNIPNVLFYEGPTTFDFQPNVYVDIGNTLDIKFKSLACHHF